jgi:hypothetical protein
MFVVINKEKEKREKKPNLKFQFVQVCYGIYSVRWAKGNGTKGSYSYSKALTMGNWFINNVEKIGK